MAEHAEGSFRVTDWKEDAYEEWDGGGKLTEARITQDFTGGIEGHGTWRTLMSYSPDGTASYVGLVRLVGSIAGRQGSFVLQTEGRFEGGEARTDMVVVPGSGSGGLARLSGKGTSVAPHGSTGTYTLDYDLG